MQLALLFEKLNSRHAGHITMNQLGKWICPDSRMLEESGRFTCCSMSITFRACLARPCLCLYVHPVSARLHSPTAIFPLIGQLVDAEKENELSVDEFIVVVNSLCTMNEEEIARHVFHCMANDRDTHNEPYVNLHTLEQWFVSFTLQAHSSHTVHSPTRSRGTHPVNAAACTPPSSSSCPVGQLSSAGAGEPRG